VAAASDEQSETAAIKIPIPKGCDASNLHSSLICCCSLARTIPYFTHAPEKPAEGGEAIDGRFGVKVVETAIPGVLIIEPEIFGDSRGFFMETYQVARYAVAGISRSFVQDNLSRSSHGVLRGLHLQNPGSQGKLVCVLSGSVLDVAVDVRRGSPSFGQHVALELTDQNRQQLWIPRGFAHGFVVMSDSADFFYKCDAPYSPSNEIVVRWNDPALGIKWGIKEPILSKRDAAAPLLADVDNLLVYEP
jgi:dTDP-4-dehydrorhamnose 3,5-epimerase